jgi:hypothetical protein
LQRVYISFEVTVQRAAEHSYEKALGLVGRKRIAVFSQGGSRKSVRDEKELKLLRRGTGEIVLWSYCPRKIQPFAVVPIVARLSGRAGECP